MMQLRYIIIVLLIGIFNGLLVAQTESDITFNIRDSINKAPLEAVTISVLNTPYGGITNDSGNCTIHAILPNNFTVKYSLIGYASSIKQYMSSEISPEKTIQIFMNILPTVTNDVVIMALRNNSRMENTPANVEVLGLEEVNEENSIMPGNVSGLLGDIAGVQLQRTSSITGSSNIRLEGLDGRYTQILRDGLPLYGEFSGNFGILQILPIDLQQIEIMKGSASTLYGADAVSGMINLISRRPSKKTEGSILLNQTSQDEKNGNFFISGRTTDLDLGYTLVAAVNRQTIRDVNNDGISDIPDWRNFSIHPKIFYSFNDKSTVEFGLSSLWEKRSGGSMAEYNRFNKPFEISTTTQRFGTELNYNQTLSNESSIQFRAATSRLTRELQNPEYYYKGVENILFTEASYSKKISTTNNVAGINFSSNTLNNIVSNLMVEPGYNLYTLGMFAQSDFNATENFLIQAGIRTDFTNNYGNSFLPHLAFMYKHSSAMSSRFNLGMGYKNPLIFSYIDEERELAKLSPNQQPLEHEKSMSANYAFDVNFPINQEITVNFNQSIFFISISNPVIRSYDTEKRIILQNASGTMESFGWQTYMRAKLDETELYLSYIYTHATQKSERGKDWVPATPLHTISAILTLELTDDSKIGIESSYFGPQFLSEGGRTPGYFFFAAMASYTLNKLTFVINCENLLNYRQSNYIEYGNGIPENKTLWAPIDGRVANISIKYSF